MGHAATSKCSDREIGVPDADLDQAKRPEDWIAVRPLTPSPVPGLVHRTGPATGTARRSHTAGGRPDPDVVAVLRRAAPASLAREESRGTPIGRHPTGSGRTFPAANPLETLRRAAVPAGAGVPDAAEPVRSALAGPGRSLDPRTLSTMEDFFRRDLSDVRIHDDSAADRSAVAVSAAAYTVGSDILFRRGRYAPGTAAGRNLLAHELTHVFQPGDRSPAGSAEDGGLRISDPGDRDEVEAVRVAEDFAAGRSCPLPPDREESTPAAAGTLRPLALRRLVGFEFETGWLVTNTPPTQTPNLKKKDPIGPPWAIGFKLEADEAGGGASEVEFIVHPPIDEGALGYGRLEQVMAAIDDLGQRMELVAARNPGASFTMDLASKRPVDRGFTITPTETKKLSAGPQVTTGLDLGRIPALRSSTQNLGVFDDETPRAQVPAELASTIDNLSSRARGIRGNHAVPDPSDALRGLVTVITNYLRAGADKNKGQDLEADIRTGLALSYPKQIGDALLARTDFAKLFALIHRSEQLALTKNPDNWFSLVLSNTDPDLKLTIKDSVIGRGIQNDEMDPSQGFTVPDLTIGAWLGGMLHQVDLLPLLPGAESMGEFGNRTEIVGGKSGELFDMARPAGIFEFRGAQTKKIPLARWGPFALEFHRYITQLHAG